MSASAFVRLQDALLAHLGAAPAPAGGRVYAYRGRPIWQDEASAVSVRMHASAADNTVIGAADWHTTLYIDCAARGVPGGASAEAVADELLSTVHARLHSFADTQAARDAGVMQVAGGAAIEWDYVPEDTPYACASLRIVIAHRTPANTLQPWS